MIYKTTSFKVIISKVNRDFNLTGTSWINSAIEWMGEGLDDIGHHVGLEKLSCVLTSDNHKALYPCNHESTLFLEYCGRKLPKGGTKSFGKFTHVTGGSSFNEDSFPLVIDTTTVNQDVVTVNNAYGQYYLENPDYIITSFESDEFILHYQGYVLDEEGFPRIPDSPYHREALAFYILYKYLSRGNKHPVWDIKSSFDMFKDYRHKARNRAKFPDLGSADRFRNMWCRIVTTHDLPDRFFGTSENTQQLFNV